MAKPKSEPKTPAKTPAKTPVVKEDVVKETVGDIAEDTPQDPNVETCIDWKALIPDSEIVLNREAFLKKGINVNELSKEDQASLKAEAAENEKLIKLNGFKHLARLRGLKASKCHVVESSAERVVVQQMLSFLPNSENPEGLEVHAVANATLNNVMGATFQSYLEPIAQNRAFVRAVKDALGINILGQDELPLEANAIIVEKTAGPSIHAALDQVMESKCISWSDLKATLVSKEHEYQGCRDWNSSKDIPQATVLGLLTELKKINQGK